MAGDVWFADSAPGNAQPATLLKCGGRKPSLGLSVPSPFVITSPGGGGVDALADRALITPGTHPTLSRDNATRAEQIGFATKNTVHFDGATALHGFGKAMPASSSGLALSAWIYSDGTCNGALLRSAFSALGQTLQICPVIGNASALETTTFMSTRAGPDKWDDIVGSFGGAAGNYFQFAGSTNSAYYNTDDFSPNLTGLFYHLMLSFTISGSSAHVTMYANDTAILSNVAMHAAGSGTIPYSILADGSPPKPNSARATVQANEWQIGGETWRVGQESGDPNNNPLNNAGPGGNGMRAAVTELWIALGHSVDWSVGATRNKFHTTDAVGNYVPVNLGTRGQAAGFAPSVYCTGGPAMFRINRATNKLLDMYGGSRDETFVPNYGSVLNMMPDDRVPGG